MQTEKVVDHIVNWLKNYATSANMDGLFLELAAE